jgi:hypothetical protein
MKVAILAGGFGSRLVEETRSKSKAMVRIGDEPVLWHIVKYYAGFGFRDVVVALGYRADSVQDYFAESGMERLPDDRPEVQVWRGEDARPAPGRAHQPRRAKARGRDRAERNRSRDRLRRCRASGLSSPA